MPTNTNVITSDTNIVSTDTNTNIITAPFPFPAETTAEVVPEVQVTETITELAKPTVIQKTSLFIQEKTEAISSIFPKTLESSGYVILSAVALIFSLALLICARRFNKLIAIAHEKNDILQKNLQEKNEIFQDITVSLYAQQQVIEYRLLLSDLNNANSTIEKTNARTQLYNFLNIICLDIYTTKNSYLALQLATSFFTKIQTRYERLSPLPDGLVYFKHIGKILTDTKDTLDEQSLIQKIQTDLINTLPTQQEELPEVVNEEMIIPNTDIVIDKKSWFPSKKKK